MDETIKYNIPRILLMEDNLADMQKISDTLMPAGYDLHYSIAGQNFTEMIYKNKYELILISVLAKGLTAFELLKKVKQNDLNKETPILFISNQENKNEIIQGFHISGIDFIKEPFSRQELLTRINNLITLIKTKKRLELSRSVTKSIRYADKIQRALMPDDNLLKNSFNDYFLINLPKDIVSGDFYWFKKIGDLTFVALGDCTGHGVPGAFLSVLGISLLNEIMAKPKIKMPGTILNKLREKLQSALLRAKGQSPISDGMDISLIVIDAKHEQLYFSAAYHRILIARQNEIIELKGDQQPIGFYPAETSFSNIKQSLKMNDKIYLSSDGYIDQFGGKQSKKYQYRNYRNLIREIFPLDMDSQKGIILKEHMEWKGINEQVDDILMIGLHL